MTISPTIRSGQPELAFGLDCCTAGIVISVAVGVGARVLVGSIVQTDVLLAPYGVGVALSPYGEMVDRGITGD